MLAALVAVPLSVAGAGLAGGAAPPNGPPGGRAEIEQRVLDEIAARGETTFWVLLRERADLSRARGIRDWGERGRFVYDRLTHAADVSQSGLRGLLKKRGVAFQPFWIANTIRVTAGESVLKELAAQPEVEKILADRVYHVEKPLAGSTEAAVNAIEWNIDRIRAPLVWSTFADTGQGVVVANIDTGVQYNHPALVGHYRGNQGGSVFNHNYNWYDPSHICSGSAPCDNNNHGTHTMGTMVGDDGAGNQIGVAPGAKWIAAKGCETNSCSTSALLSSGQWVLAPTDLNGNNPRADLRPNIVNNSWGGGSGDPWYQSTVDSWVAAGIFPAFANGNSGPGCGSAGSPGDYLSSYSAGAFDSSNNIASFSGRGPSAFSSELKPNIAAPGVSVRSSIPTSGYTSYSGTSMASPHVAGAVALIWAAAPALLGDVAATRQLLDDTAIDVANSTCGGTTDDNNVFGEGRLDVFAAVNAAPRGPAGTLAGTVTASGGGAINGAKVEAVGPITRSTFTDATGQYSLLLSAGTYSVTASAFGKVSKTTTGVVVSDGGTTNLDFALDAAPSHSVSGVVNAGSGNPVANATVTILDTPIVPATTNGSGAYSFASVPDGTYDVQATAGRCTNPQTQTLALSGGNATLNFNLALRKDNFGYSCSVGAASFISGVNQLSLSGDDAAQQVTLPFSFGFYGQSYTTAYVATNGFLELGSSTGSTVWSNVGIPDPGAPNGIAAPFWDDLYVDSPTASVWTATLTSPSRFVVEWRNVSFFGDSTRRVTFEIVLYQDGRVLTQYTGIASDGREQGNSATIGTENAAGTDGLQYSFNDAAAAEVSSATTTAISDGLAVLYSPPTTSGPTITTVSLHDGTRGQSYSPSETLAASGGTPPYTWSLAPLSNPLPPNLSLSSGGVISGTVDATATLGANSFTVKVTDSAVQSSTQTFSIDIRDPVNITTASPLPNGTANQSYSQTIAATGGKTSYTFGLAPASNPLPTGLTLSSGGVLSGTPTTPGTSTFTVRVADSGNPARTDDQAFSLTIDPGSSMTITTASPLPAGKQGQAYSATLAASGGTLPITWTLTGGTMPPGLTLSPGGGISGTPTKVANFTFTVQASDSSPAPLTATKTFTLKINKK